MPKKILKYSLLVFAVLAALLVLLAAWILNGPPLTPAKEKAYRILPIPIAFIGGQGLLARDFVQKYRLAENFYAPKNQAQIKELEKNVLDALVQQKKLAEVAEKFSVSVSQRELDAEFSRRDAQALKDQHKSLDSLLKSAGISVPDFKQSFLKPDLLATNLTVWFNGQKDRNKEGYARAEELKAKLDSGASLESLAAGESEDNSSKLLEGDLGFVQISEILPELQQGLDSLETGKSEILPSRYGLHLIKLEERDNNGDQHSARLHLKQIFIKPADFQSWYDNQTKNIKVKNIIKI